MGDKDKAITERSIWSRWPDVRSYWGREFDRLDREMGRLSRALVTEREAGIEAWSPQVDLKETDETLTLTASVPGVPRENLEVAIDDESIEVKGERKEEKETTEKGYHVKEQSYGSFYRRITLPAPIDAEKATADLKDGVLTVTLPKRPGTTPRTVKIPIN